jgi:arsenate reductase
MKKILVLCTGNSCRSQIAEGYLRHFGGDQVAVYSAGVETHGVNPRAVETMKADGIDISGHTSNHLTEYLQIPFDLILTVCDHAQEACPVFPGHAKKIHHNFPDPAKATGTEEEIRASFRQVRDQLKIYCQALIDSIG